MLNPAMNGISYRTQICRNITVIKFSTFELVEMVGKVQNFRIQGRSRGKILDPAPQLLY